MKNGMLTIVDRKRKRFETKGWVYITLIPKLWESAINTFSEHVVAEDCCYEYEKKVYIVPVINLIVTKVKVITQYPLKMDCCDKKTQCHRYLYVSQ